MWQPRDLPDRPADSSASRTARSRNSNEYSLGAPIDAASPSTRTTPGSGASNKLRVLQELNINKANSRTMAAR